MTHAFEPLCGRGLDADNLSFYLEVNFFYPSCFHIRSMISYFQRMNVAPSRKGVGNRTREQCCCALSECQ